MPAPLTVPATLRFPVTVTFTQYRDCDGSKVTTNCPACDPVSAKVVMRGDVAASIGGTVDDSA